MNESIKQAMHLDACKSFGAAEANENERRWDDKMIDSKNNDSINNYDNIYRMTILLNPISQERRAG